MKEHICAFYNNNIGKDCGWLDAKIKKNKYTISTMRAKLYIKLLNSNLKNGRKS